MAVIFGSPGLFDVTPVYDMLAQKIMQSKKPLYPIFPSPVNNEKALQKFISDGNYFYPEESHFGEALAKVIGHTTVSEDSDYELIMDEKTIRSIIETAEPGYLDPADLARLLRAAKIPMVKELYAKDEHALKDVLKDLDFPIVMKAVGPIHKSDIGGVILDIQNESDARDHFKKLMKKPEITSVLLQEMIKGKELFIGLKKEEKFGHLIMFGMGGIFLEVFRDVQTLLTPLSSTEISLAMKQLKSYPILEGIRGQKGINLDKFSEVIKRIGKLSDIAPEILEMDINPLMAEGDQLCLVDARLRI